MLNNRKLLQRIDNLTEDHDERRHAPGKIGRTYDRAWDDTMEAGMALRRRSDDRKERLRNAHHYLVRAANTLGANGQHRQERRVLDVSESIEKELGWA